MALGGVPVGTLHPAYSGLGQRVGWTAWTPSVLPVEAGRIYPSRQAAVAGLLAALRRLGGGR